MNWTRRRPTVDGHYWMFVPGDVHHGGSLSMVYVFADDHGEIRVRWTGTTISTAFPKGGWLLGPWSFPEPPRVNDPKQIDAPWSEKLELREITELTERVARLEELERGRLSGERPLGYAEIRLLERVERCEEELRLRHNGEVPITPGMARLVERICALEQQVATQRLNRRQPRQSTTPPVQFYDETGVLGESDPE